MCNALSAVFTGYPLLVAWEVPEKLQRYADLYLCRTARRLWRRAVLHRYADFCESIWALDFANIIVVL